MPEGADFEARLGSVLQVVYLVFNEGYSATSGDDRVRPALCEDALRLGRVLAGLVPGEGEVHGLVALMEIRASRTPEYTDWARIVALYDALVVLTPSLVIELNRAVAVSMAEGAEAGLELVETLADEPTLGGYHLLPAVRGDMLERLGRADEAAVEFARAATLTRNQAERQLLLARARDAGT